MAVKIDEPGNHHAAGGIYFGAVSIVRGYDLPVLHCDIHRFVNSAERIDHPSVPDYIIDFCHNLAPLREKPAPDCELSSVIVGGLILIVFGCIIYAIIQQMWPSMWILIAMEVVLIMVTAGAGMLDVLLEEASINLGLLMRF